MPESFSETAASTQPRPDGRPLGVLSPADFLDVLPRLGAIWGGEELCAAVRRQPEARVHLLDTQRAAKLVARRCQPPFTDPALFAQAAAAHALNGLYAAGARPLAALALLYAPDVDCPGRQLDALHAGFAAACASAGVTLAGLQVMPGETLSCGLLALGLLNPRNAEHGTAPQTGDVLILAKPLGDGLYRAAQARGALAAHDVREWLDAVVLKPGCSAPVLDCLDGVHQVCELGAGGLLASLQTLLRPGRGLRLDRAALPLLPRAMELAAMVGKTAPGAGTSLRAGFALAATERVESDSPFDPAFDPYPAVLADTPLNGPLLIVCHPDTVTETLAIFLQQGFGHAAVIGAITAGSSELVWV